MFAFFTVNNENYAAVLNDPRDPLADRVAFAASDMMDYVEKVSVWREGGRGAAPEVLHRQPEAGPGPARPGGLLGYVGHRGHHGWDLQPAAPSRSDR